MKTRKNLYPICFAVLLCVFEVAVLAGQSKSQTDTPEDWPTQLGKRKLYPSKYGFVYAGKKSSAAKIDKIIYKVVEDMDEESLKPVTKGLVMVMDKKEKPPFEVEELLIMSARKESWQKEGQDPQKAMESLKKSKKQMEELGLDMNLILSIAPMPIEPNMLPDLIRGFPKGVGRQIEWCMAIPTESNIQYGMKKMLGASMKKEKIGIVKKTALLPLLAIAEHKAVNELKKARQVTIYQFFVDKQEHLTDKQKEDKVKAYEERL